MNNLFTTQLVARMASAGTGVPSVNLLDPSIRVCFYFDTIATRLYCGVDGAYVALPASGGNTWTGAQAINMGTVGGTTALMLTTDTLLADGVRLSPLATWRARGRVGGTSHVMDWSIGVLPQTGDGTDDIFGIYRSVDGGASALMAEILADGTMVTSNQVWAAQGGFGLGAGVTSQALASMFSDSSAINPAQAFGAAGITFLAVPKTPDTASGYRSLLPIRIGLPAQAPTGNGGDFTAGVRLTFSDSSTLDYENATAGAVSVGLSDFPAAIGKDGVWIESITMFVHNSDPPGPPTAGYGGTVSIDGFQF